MKFIFALLITFLSFSTSAECIVYAKDNATEFPSPPYIKGCYYNPEEGTLWKYYQDYSKQPLPKRRGFSCVQPPLIKRKRMLLSKRLWIDARWEVLSAMNYREFPQNILKSTLLSLSFKKAHEISETKMVF